MGQDQSTWDYGVKFTGERTKPQTPIEPATSHKLTHDPLSSRWSCECGYVLGDGREAFLAPCPMALAAKNHKAKSHRKKKQNDDTNKKRPRRR
jgi:hypothetical protein